MTGLVAGIGIRAAVSALAGKAASNAVSDVKGVGKWLGSLDLAHFLLLVLAMFGAWQTVGRWAQHRHTAKVEAQLSEAIVKLTAARNDLAASQANEAALKKAIGDQNAAISDLGTKTQAQQQIAAKASQAAVQRAEGAEAVAERLRQSSRSAPLKSASAAPCEPSDVLKGQWK